MYLFSDEITIVPSSEGYEVRSVARVLKVSSIGQIRRKRGARLKRMAFVCVGGDKMKKINVYVCL